MSFCLLQELRTKKVQSCICAVLTCVGLTCIFTLIGNIIPSIFLYLFVSTFSPSLSDWLMCVVWNSLAVVGLSYLCWNYLTVVDIGYLRRRDLLVATCQWRLWRVLSLSVVGFFLYMGLLLILPLEMGWPLIHLNDYTGLNDDFLCLSLWCCLVLFQTAWQMIICNETTLVPPLRPTSFFVCLTHFLKSGQRRCVFLLAQAWLVFLVLYLWLGSSLRNLLTVPSVSLVQVQLHWWALCSGLYLRLIMQCTLLAVKHVALRPVDFPVPKEVELRVALQDELNNSMLDPLQSLLFFRFLLTKVAIDKCFRAHIFSLSEFSEKPHQWTKLYGSIECTLRRFLEIVKSKNNAILKRGHVPCGIAYQQDRLPKDLRLRLHLATPFTAPPASPRVCSELPPLPEWSMSVLGRKVCDLLARLRLVAYWQDEMPTAGSLLLFQRGTVSLDDDFAGVVCRPTSCGESVTWDNGSCVGAAPIVWGHLVEMMVLVLQYVVCHSYEEDEFGCVQMTLGRMLALLCQLHEEVERHLKLVGLLGLGCEPSDFKLFFSHMDAPYRIQAALSDTLYAICHKFGQHLDNVDLDPVTKTACVKIYAQG